MISWFWNCFYKCRAHVFAQSKEFFSFSCTPPHTPRRNGRTVQRFHKKKNTGHLTIKNTINDNLYTYLKTLYTSNTKTCVINIHVEPNKQFIMCDYCCCSKRKWTKKREKEKNKRTLCFSFAKKVQTVGNVLRRITHEQSPCTVHVFLVTFSLSLKLPNWPLKTFTLDLVWSAQRWKNFTINSTTSEWTAYLLACKLSFDL